LKGISRTRIREGGGGEGSDGVSLPSYFRPLSFLVPNTVQEWSRALSSLFALFLARDRESFGFSRNSVGKKMRIRMMRR